MRASAPLVFPGWRESVKIIVDRGGSDPRAMPGYARRAGADAE
ncbi:hypothetical protein [Veronia pacifica]|nr:hypothetical protein [Veronia pacifica]